MTTPVFRFQQELMESGIKQVFKKDMTDNTYSIVGGDIHVQIDGILTKHFFNEEGNRIGHESTSQVDAEVTKPHNKKGS